MAVLVGKDIMVDVRVDEVVVVADGKEHRISRMEKLYGKIVKLAIDGLQAITDLGNIEHYRENMKCIKYLVTQHDTQ